MVDDLYDRIQRALSPQDRALLQLVAEAAQELGVPLYAVGGMPRDLILGRSPRDLDLVVEGDAVQLAQSLARSHGGSVTAHRRFGTATWSRGAPARSRNGSDEEIWGGSLDLTTARAEVYRHPAQLPQVSPGTIVDDLGRRDFTINAIAIRLDGAHFGRVLDPVGGVLDLRRLSVRVLHNRSFVDDPTRLYRAVRYEQRLGFRISSETRALIRDGGRWVGAVSGQRLRHELDLILEETRRAAMLKRLLSLGLLRMVHPALPGDTRCLRRIDPVSPWEATARSRAADPSAGFAGWMLWLMDLRPAGLRSVGRRLAFTRKELELILAAAGLYQSAERWGRWRPSRLTFKLDGIPQPAIEAVLAALSPGKPRRALESYLSSWRHVHGHLTGSDIRARGLEPGPRFRSILQTLRAAWIDGAIQDVDGEKLLLERLMRGDSRRGRADSTRRTARARR